jgi:hypothetical protein
MWPIHLLLFSFYVNIPLILDLRKTVFSHDRSNWSHPSFPSTVFQNFPDISDLLSVCIYTQNVQQDSTLVTWFYYKITLHGHMWPTARSWTVFKTDVTTRFTIRRNIRCTSGCQLQLLCSWWWVRKVPEIKILVLHLVGHFVCIYIEDDARNHEPTFRTNLQLHTKPCSNRSISLVSPTHFSALCLWKQKCCSCPTLPLQWQCWV